MKYIVVGLTNGPFCTDERPTQEQIKSYGEGEYVLRREDGSISKKFHVVRNRNGNLKVDATDPTGLEGISTLNLTRMQRDYGRIVKLWPASASARDYTKVVNEIQARAILISTSDTPRKRRATEVEAVSA